MHESQTTAYEIFKVGEEPTVLMDQPAVVSVWRSTFIPRVCSLWDLLEFTMGYALGSQQGQSSVSCPTELLSKSEKLYKDECQFPADAGRICKRSLGVAMHIPKAEELYITERKSDLQQLPGEKAFASS